MRRYAKSSCPLIVATEEDAAQMWEEARAIASSILAACPTIYPRRRLAHSLCIDTSMMPGLVRMPAVNFTPREQLEISSVEDYRASASSLALD